MEQPLSAVDNERVLRLYRRTIALVNLALAIVVVVLGIALTVGLAIAQNEAEVAQDLRIELECRAVAAGEFSIAQAELDVLIAEGLVLLEAGEPLDSLIEQLSAAAQAVREAADDRLTSADSCVES